MVGFISLAEAKDQLRLEQDETDEDVLIQQTIDDASALIEETTGHVALQREVEFVFDCWGRALELRLRPVVPEGMAISYLDSSGTSQPFTAFRTVAIRGTLQIVPDVGANWPAHAITPGAITVTATVGYGTNDTTIAATAPNHIRRAVRLLVSHWDANREAVNVGNIVTELPLGVEHLLRSERLRRV